MSNFDKLTGKQLPIKDNTTVHITAKHYDSLLHDRMILRKLREYGVDNWEGYSDAMSELYGDEEEAE
jgi:hypothetical protein